MLPIVVGALFVVTGGVKVIVLVDAAVLASVVATAVTRLAE